MSTTTKFFKVSALPDPLVANAFYFVENGTYAESYLTNTLSVAKMIGNSVMIDALIDAKLANYDGNITIVDDITARDSITGQSDGRMVMVTDASADASVSGGAALYIWNGTNYIKLTEYESLDVDVEWANILNKPSSSVTLIDDAVTKRHEHANKAVIDVITDDGNGNLKYNADLISAWGTLNW